MYSELVYDNINILEDEIHSVRYKYGLDEEQVRVRTLVDAILHRCIVGFFLFQKFSEAQAGINDSFTRSMLAQHLKVDQSTDTADLQPIQSVFHSRIKEEETHVVEVSPVSVKRTRRTRRSKKQAQLPMEYGKCNLFTTFCNQKAHVINCSCCENCCFLNFLCKKDTEKLKSQIECIRLFEYQIK